MGTRRGVEGRGDWIGMEGHAGDTGEHRQGWGDVERTQEGWKDVGGGPGRGWRDMRGHEGTWEGQDRDGGTRGDLEQHKET